MLYMDFFLQIGSFYPHAIFVKEIIVFHWISDSTDSYFSLDLDVYDQVLSLVSEFQFNLS